MNSKNQLIEFLQKAKNQATSTIKPAKIVHHFVIGNESADLDSIVSAITYAFYHAKISQDDTVFIPVVSIPEDELELRTEVIALLQKFEIPPNALTFLKNINFSTFNSDSLKVTLVDHNNISNSTRQLKDFIVEIIDHHQDSLDFADILKIIRTVGSCCTLIAEKINNDNDINLFSTTPIIAELLLSGILVDTYNLDLHSGRTTELDIFMGEVLCGYSNEDPDQLFSFLQKAKLNISSMSSYNIFRKDFKLVSNDPEKIQIGISSATMPAIDFLQRCNIQQAVTDFTSLMNLRLLVVMFLHFKNNSLPTREIAVICHEKTLLNEVCDYLCSYKVDLDLQEIKLESNQDLKESWRLFSQQNIKSSRKVVLPLLLNMKR